jgi:Right handed beta helix region
MLRPLTALALAVALLTAGPSYAGPTAGPSTERAAAHRVVGHGTPASCTAKAFRRAVAKGGVITFSCGPKPVTIVLDKQAEVHNTSSKVVIDGGGLVTLSGGGKTRILYQNTCEKRLTWTTSHCNDQATPKLVLRNLTFTHGNSTGQLQEGGGGGAVFVRGGRLSVVNSTFTRNKCDKTGPDLGGAAIRVLDQFHDQPVTIDHSTFTGGRCSNGSGLSSIGVSWTVTDSVFRNNKALGRGANPAGPGTPGGGSGGAIYLDGNLFTLRLVRTTIEDNVAREGGGAVFFVSNDRSGSLVIQDSTLHHNPSLGFETYPGIFYLGHGDPDFGGSTID